MNVKVSKKLLKLSVEASSAEMKKLVKEGADVNYADAEGMSALLHCAAYNTKVTALKYLLSLDVDKFHVEEKYKSNALSLAAHSNSNPKLLAALLEEGLPLEGRNYLGETPLILAASNPNSKMALYLIEAGADVNARDYQGHSVLDHAKRSASAVVVKKLEELGAK